MAARALLVGFAVLALVARPDAAPAGERRMAFEFVDAEIGKVIEALAVASGQSFIYDSEVKGRVTIRVPSRVTVAEAHEILNASLRMQGLIAVPAADGFQKIVPITEFASTAPWIPLDIDPDRERVVTTLIRVDHADVGELATLLQPYAATLAVLIPYPPTSSLIVAGTESHLRTLADMIDAFDIGTSQRLSVLSLRHADAAATASWIQETDATTPDHEPDFAVWPEPRTNSLIVRASEEKLDGIRKLVARLDVPADSEGIVFVHPLRHADAEELVETLRGLIEERPATATEGTEEERLAAQVIRATQGLEDGLNLAADPATNSILIAAAPGAYAALLEVIELLDIPRPQVLIETLVIGVDVTHAKELGFNGVVRLVHGDTDIGFRSATDTLIPGFSQDAVPSEEAIPFLGRFFRSTIEFDADGIPISNGTLVEAVFRAAASDRDASVLAAPQVLTVDNEEAQIEIGDNIPVVTGRVQSAGAIDDPEISTGLNVERQDVGVVLRITPQINEGETVLLDLFQELTAINPGLTATTGGASDTGVALSKRVVESKVLLADGESVVVGSLLGERRASTVNKVPWLGDVPWLGTFFKSTRERRMTQNLLVLVTPHIVRTPEQLEIETLRTRQQHRDHGPELSTDIDPPPAASVH